MNLYISCDGGSISEVVSFAENFTWRYGTYEVIKQKEQLGVDAHNLACMGLAKDLGNIVILEDDLVVSPSFQLYLIEIQSIAKLEKQVAGVSLYRYPMIEQDHFPFELIPNDEFIYYQQRSSSNGCFYTWEMLESYFSFLDTFKKDFNNYVLPQNVQKWGDEVWEKSYYCYLQETNKYLAFPRYSITSDFADIGVHMKKQTNKYAHQSSLFLGNSIAPAKKIEDTDNVYDAFYELHPKTLLKYLPKLGDYAFTSDIYGYKEVQDIASEYLISSKECSSPLVTWDRRLKPEVNNLLLDERGKFYSLGRTADFKEERRKESLKEKFLYYYPDTRLISLVKMKFSEVISRFLK